MLRERHAPEQCGDERAADDREVPAASPCVVVDLPAVLQCHPAQDERDQDQQQRQVEAGEQRRVPLGEGGEGGAAGDEEPHLVAVPDRPDRAECDTAVGLVARDQRQQHADAEVEALQDEVAGPQHGDEQEPDVGECHGEVSGVLRR